MKLYLTGGTVRDYMLREDAPNTDYDFAVEAASYEDMETKLRARGLLVWQMRPDYVTLRGQLPRAALGDFDGLLTPLTEFQEKTGRTMVSADFTLCRAETMYSDGRHPDKVTPASLGVDLARRDFTVNAVAVSEDGEWFDPWGGQMDALDRVLRTVGDPGNRFTEDPLRMLRAFRFVVTRGLLVAGGTSNALGYCAPLLKGLPVERVEEELRKAFKHDWYQAATVLVGRDFGALGARVRDLYPNLWLKATKEDK